MGKKISVLLRAEFSHTTSLAGWVSLQKTGFGIRGGEALIGDRTAQPASAVSQVCEFGPPLLKGAKMDHVETGSQSSCIWKANFPGC